jgi:hypothetical protein
MRIPGARAEGALQLAGSFGMKADWWLEKHLSFHLYLAPSALTPL